MKMNMLFVMQGGKCFYCQKIMQPLGSFTGAAGVKPPHDLATIEHLHSKLNPARAVHSPVVIACHSCNQRRNRLEAQAIPMELRQAVTQKSPYKSFPAHLAALLNGIGQKMRQVSPPPADYRRPYAGDLGWLVAEQARLISEGEIIL